MELKEERMERKYVKENQMFLLEAKRSGKGQAVYGRICVTGYLFACPDTLDEF